MSVPITEADRELAYAASDAVAPAKASVALAERVDIRTIVRAEPVWTASG